MPDMKVCPNSGGIVFHLTPEEKRMYNMKKQLEDELQQVQTLRKQLEEMLAKANEAQKE